MKKYKVINLYTQTENGYQIVNIPELNQHCEEGWVLNTVLTGSYKFLLEREDQLELTANRLPDETI